MYKEIQDFFLPIQMGKGGMKRDINQISNYSILKNMSPKYMP